jgi:hypothetical protein
MLGFVQDAILVVVIVTTALLFMAGLNLAWPPQSRRTHNDIIGWQLSVLGTTYAVILGFMLYTVWTNYGAADANVDQEAGALANFYALTENLPEPQRGQLQALARDYAQQAIHGDWPRMRAGQLPDATLDINNRMWKTLMTAKPQSAPELAAQDHALSQLSALTEHRRIRLLQNASQLPGVLWCVLLAGAALTIVSCCMFGAESVRLHAVQVFALSLLVSLCLAAIADINRPFQGAVHLSDLAFVRAQQTMQQR